MESIVLKNKKKLGTSRRHPWVYSGAVAEMPESVVAGDIVAVRSADGALVGYGHRVVGKSIVCRIFLFSERETAIDNEFWLNKFRNALNYRKMLGLGSHPETDSFRLFNSEGDELPGLTCDVFGQSAALHIASEGMEALLDLLAGFLKSELGIQNIFIKSPKKTYWLGEQARDVRFVENGLKLISLMESGQKTGYFLDQRENRALVGRFAKGRKVLDAFCYLGGFGLHALQGSAQAVTFVDASRLALESVEKNVSTNFNSASVTYEAKDCFEFLRDMAPNDYDMIVLDPPAFAKKADFINQAARGYKEINLMALRKISRGGLLFTFSCSQHISKELFRTIVYQASLDAGRTVRVMHEMGQAADHAVNIFHPEGDYLKGLALYVD